MKMLRRLVRRLVREERGQTATEYLMVISVLTIAALAATPAFTSAFCEGMNALTASLGSSLTTDGVRP